MLFLPKIDGPERSTLFGLSRSEEANLRHSESQSMIQTDCISQFVYQFGHQSINAFQTKSVCDGDSL